MRDLASGPGADFCPRCDCSGPWKLERPVLKGTRDVGLASPVVPARTFASPSHNEGVLRWGSAAGWNVWVQEAELPPWLESGLVDGEVATWGGGYSRQQSGWRFAMERDLPAPSAEATRELWFLALV